MSDRSATAPMPTSRVPPPSNPHSRLESVEVGRVGWAVVAAAVVVVSLDGASYALAARSSLAIAVWWLIACAFAVGLGEMTTESTAARIAMVSALVFSAVVAASVTWAANPEGAFLEFDRVLLYLGVGVLVALTPRDRIVTWADGCAFGIAIVAVLALTSRFFPSLLGAHELPRFLPGTEERLSYPLDYWNGLAVLLAIGTPLLLRAAVMGPPSCQAFAAAAMPVLVCAAYLTASRTGAVALLIAAGLFVGLSADRWRALLTTFLVATAATLALVVLRDRPLLVNGPFDGDRAAADGRMAAISIALICAAAGFLNYLLQRRHDELPRPGSRVGFALASLTLAAGIVLVGISHPRARLVAFTRAPALAAVSQPNFVQAHLLSAGGGGRWQFWAAALDEFEAHPVLGRGAGSFEAWWSENGSLPVFVRYAHSLYLQTLGELGVVGFVLLIGAVGCAAWNGIIALVHARGQERTTLAAVVAAATAYLVAAGVDWMWELTAVTVVGVSCLGMLAVARTPRPRGTARRSGRLLLRASVVTGALIVIACEGLPLLTDGQLRASQLAARSGDGVQARTHALRAVALEPWAASPYVQLALVDEQNRDLRFAASTIRSALRRNDQDWRTWLVAARIETRLGEIGKARRSLEQAERLNPRSPIFRAAHYGSKTSR
jgi:hypothetical protein